MESKLPVVDADASELERVFANLIGNALKYHDEDVSPIVTISAESAGDRWVFTVADNGIGVDEGHREQIFRPFQRLHGQGSYSGTGMGLAIVRKIVVALGGDVWAEDSPLGGVAISFTIPDRAPEGLSP